MSPLAFVEYLTFLQTILGPSYGTNGLRWSLANEFWYYLLFPLLLIPMISKSWGVRFLGFAAFVVVVSFQQWGILAGRLIWGLGDGVYNFSQTEIEKNRSISHFLLIGILLTIGGLVLRRSPCFTRLNWLADGFSGLSVAILVVGLVSRGGESGIYAKLSKWGSEISYTLYLVHFPICFVLFFVFFRGWPLVPTLRGEISYLSLLMSVVIYATGIWWIFERNTDRVRNYICNTKP